MSCAPGTEPSTILAAALARDVTVTRFDLAEPSLEAIFIEKVGRPAGDDPTLARDDPTTRIDRDPGSRPAVKRTA